MNRFVASSVVRAAALIVVAILLSYANSLSGAFVFDDKGAILENATLRRLWPPGDVLSPPIDGLPVTGRPITNLSFALNYAVHGSNALGYHVANIAIHVLCALMLFGVVRRTLERVPPIRRRDAVAHTGPSNATPARRNERAALALATTAALLWSVHPLQTAAITYLSQRAESLATLLILFSLYAFIRGNTGNAAPRAGIDASAPGIAERAEGSEPEISSALAASSGEISDSEKRPGTCSSPSGFEIRWWLVGSVLACWLSVGTKEIACAIPLLVAVYDRLFVQDSWRRVFTSRPWFYAALFASWLPLAWLIHGTQNRGGTWGADSGFTAWEYALIQAGAIAHYLRLVFWPAPLAFDYGRNLPVPSLGAIWPHALLALGLLAATATGLRRNARVALLGVAFFAILAPTSSFVPIADPMFEHRMYLPSAAVIVAVVLGVHRWLGMRTTWFVPPVAAVLAATTIARNADYASPLTLWSDTVLKRPDNARARGNLGEVLTQQGRHAEALPHFEAAYRLTPQLPLPVHNLANSLDLLGRRDEAIRLYREALALQPRNHLARTNLAQALAETGAVDEALTHYEAVLRDEPDFAIAQHGYGRASLRAGRIDDAISALRRAVELRPQNADYRFSLADALVRTRRLPEAIEALRATLQLRPDDFAALNNLGNALLLTRRLPEAIATFEQALRLKPDPTTHTNLGLALMLSRRRAEAIAQFEAALRIDPNHPRARAALERLRP